VRKVMLVGSFQTIEEHRSPPSPSLCDPKWLLQDAIAPMGLLKDPFLYSYLCDVRQSSLESTLLPRQ
jgi:hypothetical protein